MRHGRNINTVVLLLLCGMCKPNSNPDIIYFWISHTMSQIGHQSQLSLAMLLVGWNYDTFLLTAIIMVMLNLNLEI